MLGAQCNTNLHTKFMGNVIFDFMQTTTGNKALTIFLSNEEKLTHKIQANARSWIADIYCTSWVWGANQSPAWQTRTMKWVHDCKFYLTSLYLEVPDVFRISIFIKMSQICLCGLSSWIQTAGKWTTSFLVVALSDKNLSVGTYHENVGYVFNCLAWKVFVLEPIWVSNLVVESQFASKWANVNVLRQDLGCYRAVY